MNATKTQLAQIGDICRRRGIAIEVDPSSLTREDGDRLVRALLYIDGDQQLNPDLELVRQLEATRKEKPMEETRTDKTCSRCKETKPVDDFGSNKSTPDGLSYYCKACNRVLYQERKAKKKAKRSDKDEKPEASTPEPAFIPADEDLDLGQGDGGPHWCIAELRDPRLSTIERAQEIFSTHFGISDLETTAAVLAQIADLDLA